jgi:hypothetical protein
MTTRAHGQLRRTQVITTYGPGALIDLPRYSAIVGGLETWPRTSQLEEIVEPRLARKIEALTGVHSPGLFAPPVDSDDPRKTLGIGAFRFPEWYVVQDERGAEQRERSRRLVHRRMLDNRWRFDGRDVVATRFVRACPRGHVDDVDWRGFAHHKSEEACLGQLWLDERGTSGDLADLVVRCQCGQSRSMYEATQWESFSLGACSGARPWLGRYAGEQCALPARLLIRTASNAYFPQVVSVLALPEQGAPVETAVQELWQDLQVVEDSADLAVFRRKPQVRERLADFSDEQVLAAIRELKSGKAADRSVKQVELEALLSAPEGYGEDVPIDPNFHARRIPDRAWRRRGRSDSIECVIQLHRLREVLALLGFTRFEAETPDIQGEYESDVERAEIAMQPAWFPAVENRGEGIFIQLRPDAVMQWLARQAVRERLQHLEQGHREWAGQRGAHRAFPGGPYIMLHTLSHLLVQSLAMRCGYPASSIRERVYVDYEASRFGLLLYTGSPDAEGTLGGLVQQARYVEEHLQMALQSAALCSNDPLCAQHTPGDGVGGRLLHGAACHGCTLIAEPSCEMRNDYLDRALVVGVLGLDDAALFGIPG